MAEEVGKSSLIEVLITNHFEEVVQPVLPPIVVPEDATPERVHVSIVDTPGGSVDTPRVDDGLKSADVVVLVYAVDNPSSISRVRSFWLKKFREMHLKVPIVLVGNKIDTRGAATDPQAAENMEAFIRPIMDEHREVEVCIECSAKTLSNVAEVFYFAQKSVLHPTGPLYNLETQSLSSGAAAALRRIFSLCDSDKDGALNDKELNDFQYKCFSIHLAPDELEGVKKVVRENRPSNGLTKDGFLSAEGFLFLHMLFVQKGRLETTWIVLRKFGYSDDLRLTLGDGDKITKSDDQSVELTPAAIAFITEKFHAADKDMDKLLSQKEFSSLFEDCPDGALFSPKFDFVPSDEGKDESTIRTGYPNPDTVMLAKVDGGFQVSPERTAGPQPDSVPKKGYMTLDAFLARWAILALESPESVMLTLMYLGFNEPPLSALKVTKPRKRDRYNRTVSRNVFNVLVVGDPEVSRSNVVRGLAGFCGTDKSSPGVIAARCIAADEAFGGGNRTLVMRDVPSGELSQLFGSRRELEACDVMCIVFNSASMDSFDHARSLYSAIQAKSNLVKFPTVFVACRGKAGVADLPAVVNAAGEFCEKNSLAAPECVSPRDGDFGTLYEDLVGVALNPHVACPDYYDLSASNQSSAFSTGLKVAACAALVCGGLYVAKRVYDYYTTKPSRT